MPEEDMNLRLQRLLPGSHQIDPVLLTWLLPRLSRPLPSRGKRGDSQDTNSPRRADPTKGG